MGILYLDEAGNTGLFDNSQKKLIYGGPYVTASVWSKLNTDIANIQMKYKGIIISRFKQNINLANVESTLTFFSQFHIHAKEVINRNGLWSKLDYSETFQVLEDILDLLIKNNVVFYAGILDKSKVRPANKPKKNDMREYKILLPAFIQYIENNIGEQEETIVFIDDGDQAEIEILRETLWHNGRSKCFGELVVGKHNQYPLLQIADVGVWVIQAYERLSKSRTDKHAMKIRSLHTKLATILRAIRL